MAGYPVHRRANSSTAILMARKVHTSTCSPARSRCGRRRFHECVAISTSERQPLARRLAATESERPLGATTGHSAHIEGDLDPLYLRRKVVAGASAVTRDLSEAGTAIYARLLTECCAYVVELTSTLPRFSAGAFGEILRRQTLILQRVTRMDRMPSTDALPASTQQTEADFAATYRRQVVSQLDRLELFGVTVSDSVRGYPLSAAYISLAVSSDTLRQEYFHFSNLNLNATVVEGSASSTLRIDSALANTSRLFLRGEAGSGKTTLLQWLAVRAARQDFPTIGGATMADGRAAHRPAQPPAKDTKSRSIHQDPACPAAWPEGPAARVRNSRGRVGCAARELATPPCGAVPGAGQAASYGVARTD